MSKILHRFLNPIPPLHGFFGNHVQLKNGETIYVLYFKKELREIVDKWIIFYIYKGQVEYMDYRDLKKLLRRPLIKL